METLSLSTIGIKPVIQADWFYPEVQVLVPDMLIPVQHPTTKYGAVVDALIDPESSSPEDLFIDVSVPVAERASYNGHLSHYEELLGRALTETGVYNAFELPTGERGNIHLQAPEAADIHKHALRALYEAPVEVVAPFAREPQTIEKVIRYAAHRVGNDRVHAVNSGLDEESAEKARQTGVEVMDQPRILRHVDIDLLRRMEILPENVASLGGSKGLTMLAGLLGLEAQGKLDGRYIVFHDTDIINPGPDSLDDLRGSEEDYAALDYLALPLAYPVGPVTAINIVRTGTGRNNESWHGENQHQLDPIHTVRTKEQRLAQILAHHLGSIVWPLTGERLIRGDILRNIPWTTDMNIETLLNVTLAGIDLRSGERGIMQVADPAHKSEAGESIPPREWCLLYGCESGLRTYFQTIQESGRLLHEWDPVDIGIYNLYYGNRSHRTITKGRYDHQPNVVTKYKRGLLLPSINSLIQIGAVDLEAIRQELMRK